MQVFQGHSELPAGRAAVAEATRDWPSASPPSFILAYASTRQALADVHAALRERYPLAQLAGCTTSGEHSTHQHHRRSLVLTAVCGDDLRVTTALAPDLAKFDQARADGVADGLFRALGVSRDDVDLEHTFCFMLIDGLSLQEEHVSAVMAEALDGVPLVGGSAGDDLAFQRTEVMGTDGVATAAAVFVLGQSRAPMRIFKHQHFVPTERSLVITKADVAARKVYEMDGYPAAEAYARALGLARTEDLTPAVTFMNPVMLQSHGQHYVRSVQKIDPDGAITFYCGIEEGMVLDVAHHDDIVGALGASLGEALAGIGRPKLVLGINCILRALEAEQLAQHECIAALMSKNADCYAAFDTYGEQMGGLHINQTIVGIAFGQ